MPLKVPEVVFDRLTACARALAVLERQGRSVVTSRELGERLGVTPAQIRKDLTRFGRFGTRGNGYNIARLLDDLHESLGLARQWSIPSETPVVVIDRLAACARALAVLERQGRSVVTSRELGERLGVTPAQIRKDLARFGRFGTRGNGYNIAQLLNDLRQILGLTRQWSMVLVGVGQLGRAILANPGFSSQWFRIIEVFDADPDIIGTTVDDLVVKPVDALSEVLCRRKADIGIVAVPPARARQVTDLLVASGIRAILNYAPFALQAPSGVLIRDIDPVLALQSMTYYVKNLAPASYR